MISLLIRLLRKISQIDPFEIAIFGVVAISINLIVITPNARSTAAVIATAINADLSSIGIVLLFGVFLTATTPNLWVRLAGKIPYWLFTIASIVVAFRYQLPFLGPTLYSVPSVLMLIHWLKGAFDHYDARNRNAIIK